VTIALQGEDATKMCNCYRVCICDDTPFWFDCLILGVFAVIMISIAVGLQYSIDSKDAEKVELCLLKNPNQDPRICELEVKVN
jgi:hypothetical protein